MGRSALREAPASHGVPLPVSSANASAQHVSTKAKGLGADPPGSYERNGYSNRSKIMGSSYHASSLSFNKNPKQLAQAATMSATIHQTYNGTGRHSHNSSIHSSHMKTRSPGTSTIAGVVHHPNAVAMAQGGTLPAHNFHPSVSHHKNSMSLGQYETTKVKVGAVRSPN